MEIRHYIPLALVLALAGTSCSGTRSGVASKSEGSLSSNVAMNDSNAEAQLVSGFYPVENRAWRWTAGAFSVKLGIPSGASQAGATLTAAVTIPDAVISRIKDTGLTASINGMTLKSEKYSSPGPYSFSADVPASLLAGDSVKVDFAVDKTMRPDGDKRDLGVIVNSVGIASK